MNIFKAFIRENKHEVKTRFEETHKHIKDSDLALMHSVQAGAFRNVLDAVAQLSNQMEGITILCEEHGKQLADLTELVKKL